jgi:hypothetical protein
VCIIWKSVSTLLPTRLSRRIRPPGSGGMATAATAPLNNARYLYAVCSMKKKINRLLDEKQIVRLLKESR